MEATIQAIKKQQIKVSKYDTLNISEDFYSIQGEGATTGVPAYFIRLKACNLMCGGKDGSLVKSGQATWWCDTEYVWRKGLEKQFSYLVDRWKEENILEWVNTGRVHLIWTGGEPTIPKNQKSITAFLNWYSTQFSDATVYNEIETNGTVVIDDDMFNKLDQINCSVKLANSGMSKERRIVKEALERIQQHNNHFFKFVISTEDDMKEIVEDFIIPFNIEPTRVLMMPGLDKQEDYHERTKFCLEMAKKYGFVGLTRLHVSAWDQTTGV